VQLELPSAGWIVVAGPNGSGKTTFLQILALGISRGFSEEYARTTSSFLRLGEKSGHSRVVVARTAEDQFHDSENKAIADENLVLGNTWKVLSARATSHRPLSTDTTYQGPWHDNPRGWFATGYGAFRNIMGRPGNTPEAWTSPMTRESAFLTLFQNNELLDLPIRWLMDLDYTSIDPSTRVDQHEQVHAEKLRDVGIELLNTGLLKPFKVLDVDSKGLWVEKDGQALPLAQIGSGVQTLIALVTDMLRHMEARFGELKVTRDETGKPRIENSGVVLIDEAEQHLHPQWQRQIGFWFKEHFPNIQFIVTTHSPFVCQAATEKGLILLPSDPAQPPTIADDRLYRQVVYGGVDDALLSGLFGLHRTWSDESEERREQFAHLETKVLTGHASPEERAEYKRLKEQLPLTMSDEVNRVTARLLHDLDLRR
jgi:hypothetical protein